MASNLPFKQHLHHAEHKCGMQQQQHVCRPCMHLENNKNLRPPEARKLAVGHTSVRQLVFWLLLVLSNYFTKFHDFSITIQFFSNSMIFPCMELFYRFSRFSMISRVCGKPAERGIGGQTKSNIAVQLFQN